MKFEKRFLTQLNRCYSATHVVVDGVTRILVATEGEGACLAWQGPGYDRMQTVWAGPGGTMSMVPIAGTNGEFLAVQKFFKMFQWEEAKLVHVKPLADGRYAVTDVLHLPYIHPVSYTHLTLPTKILPGFDQSSRDSFVVASVQPMKYSRSPTGTRSKRWM